jgi:hypothetical protein
MRIRSVLPAAVIALLAAAGCNGNDAAPGSGPGQSGSVLGSATSSHRMEHNEGLTYAGSSPLHRPIVDPPPSADFPDINQLQCTTSGTPKARGTIKNTTAQIADYNFAVYFYLAGQEYLGSEAAKTTSRCTR